MGEAEIVVRDLRKVYRVPEREEGLAAALRDFVNRRYREVKAVCGIDFEIGAGEVVGFIGPNGAGKTTTLKMLAGLLYPSGGEARVAGYNPWERKPGFLRSISMVLGNKSQMIWDIPPTESFRVLAEIYSVPKADYRQTLDELVDLLEMEEILAKPVRNLSLGERMKCELVAGLLYRPRVMFLDEPTLGLDVSMQARLRVFFKEYNRRSGATIILTSHYMADVTALCPRVILIHHGQLLYDGALAGLTARLAPFKIIRFTLADGKDGIGAELEALTGGSLLEQDEGSYRLRVSRADTPQVTAALLNRYHLADLTVDDPPVEAVIDQVYQSGERLAAETGAELEAAAGSGL
jgi:ABC-2 type transport system ATP-binding protein